MKKLALLLSLIVMTGCSGRGEQPPVSESASPTQSQAIEATESAPLEAPSTQLLQLQPVSDQDTIVRIETTLGTLTARLFPQKAPKAVANFIGLAEQGYYTGKTFHRVIPQFMAQGGSPGGDGIGGESIYKDEKGNSLPFEDEFSMDLWHFRGALSMANSGPDSNLSQFFIVEGYQIPDDMLAQMAQFPAPVIEQYQQLGGAPHLDWKHTVFGQVVEGLDVLDAIMAVPTENEKPVEDIIILSISVENAE